MNTTIRALVFVFFAVIALSSAKTTENERLFESLVKDNVEIGNLVNDNLDPVDKDGLETKQGLRGQQRSRKLCGGALSYCDNGSDCCSGKCIKYHFGFHFCAAY